MIAESSYEEHHIQSSLNATFIFILLIASLFSKLQLFSHDLIVLCLCTNTKCKFVSIKQIWHFIQIVKERWFFITISNFWEVFVIESIPKCSTSFHIHREIQSELYYWLDIVYCKTNVIVDSTMNNAVRVPFTMKM